MEKIISIEASKQFENDIIEYMIDVNRLRQLPDHRDGLKKVQKRIIHTMALHLPCLERRSKSSSISGMTMNISHPQLGM